MKSREDVFRSARRVLAVVQKEVGEIENTAECLAMQDTVLSLARAYAHIKAARKAGFPAIICALATLKTAQEAEKHALLAVLREEEEHGVIRDVIEPRPSVSGSLPETWGDEINEINL